MWSAFWKSPHYLWLHLFDQIRAGYFEFSKIIQFPSVERLLLWLRDVFWWWTWQWLSQWWVNGWSQWSLGPSQPKWFDDFMICFLSGAWCSITQPCSAWARATWTQQLCRTGAGSCGCWRVLFPAGAGAEQELLKTCSFPSKTSMNAHSGARMVDMSALISRSAFARVRISVFISKVHNSYLNCQELLEKISSQV